MTDRSRRQRFLGAQSDGVFTRATVAIIGLCGGGSHIAQQLAHVGFRTFRLIDPDHVEEPNLNRMVGSRPGDAAIKRLKTDVLRDLILQIQPGASVETLVGRWQEHHLALRDCTIVFGCLDSFGQRDELEAYCRRFLLPYIDIGMDVHESDDGQFAITGQIITSLPGRPCMRCTGFLTNSRIAREAERYGAAGHRPQVVWPNGVLASTAVGIAVSLVTPWNQVPLVPFVEYDGNRNELRPASVLTVVRSTVCPHYPNDVGDPFWAPLR
jgi:molybdopterin-synthase adenylyltransferase